MGCLKKYYYLLMAAFILGNYMFNPSALFAFKKKNIIHYFGKISYGLYVYHNILIPIIIMKIMINNKLNNMYFLFAAMIIFTIVVSWISYELYEKWFLKLKERFSIIKTRSA
jgi:peptidoglycan/LPS O-acetylase OafA/YrhL